jgi:hypothetical protein
LWVRRVRIAVFTSIVRSRYLRLTAILSVAGREKG